MEPTVLGGRLASAVVTPLLGKLFTPEASGAGLVDRPVRLKDLVSFRGEKRSLGEKDVGRLAAHPVGEALASPGEPPFPVAEGPAVAHAPGARLPALGDLGDLDMDDVQAIRLGHREPAARLCSAAPKTEGLSTDARYFLDSATEWSCLQILEFFTRRSTSWFRARGSRTTAAEPGHAEGPPRNRSSVAALHRREALTLTRPCSGSGRRRRPPARSAGRRAGPTSPRRGR